MDKSELSQQIGDDYAELLALLQESVRVQRDLIKAHEEGDEQLFHSARERTMGWIDDIEDMTSRIKEGWSTEGEG